MEYRLVIFNDNVNEFGYVVRALLDCIGCDITQAETAVRLVDMNEYYAIGTYTSRKEAYEDAGNLLSGGIDCDVMTQKQYEKFVASIEKK